MFRAIKDTNTGVVNDWYRDNGDGTESHFNVPRDMWKREQDWTIEEVAALFEPMPVAAPVVEETDTSTVVDTAISDEPSFL